jgi:hypothetical protein
MEAALANHRLLVDNWPGLVDAFVGSERGLSEGV